MGTANKNFLSDLYNSPMLPKETATANSVAKAQAEMLRSLAGRLDVIISEIREGKNKVMVMNDLIALTKIIRGGAEDIARETY